MTYASEENLWENRSYQEDIARSLLASMDYDDAVHFCVSNEWSGVLNALGTGGWRD